MSQHTCEGKAFHIPLRSRELDLRPAPAEDHLQDTIKGMAGTLHYDWRPAGLAVALRVPDSSLQA